MTPIKFLLSLLKAQMQSMQEELTRAKESAATMATTGQQSQPFGTTKKKATPDSGRGLANWH